MKYILLSVLILFFVGCDSKNEATEKQNSIENIIIDNAYVVSNNDKIMEQYRDFNQHLLDDFDIDFRTITISDDNDIDLFANREFKRLQKESRSHSGKAILMVINTLQDKVRLEVSMALEPVYTDAFISYIERKGFVPYFRNNTIADAIYMAAELISDRAYDATEGKEFMPPMQSKSIGAGAKTQARIGQNNLHEKRGNNVASSSSDTPMDVLKKYLASLKAHNTNPNLDIYTDATKAFFSQHTVTEANQNNEIRFLTPCMDSKKVKYAGDGVHAVLMNDPINQRKCTPHFFKKEQGEWKLDIAAMAQVLRFNAPMDWHFDKKERLKGEAKFYAFALDGYGLDKNGYPVIITKYKKPKNVKWGFQSNKWYKPGENPKTQSRCRITYVWRDSPALMRLGLQPNDYIISVGKGSNKRKNIYYEDFMNYMASLPSGALVTIEANHYDKVNNRTYHVVREGVAP